MLSVAKKLQAVGLCCAHVSDMRVTACMLFYTRDKVSPVPKHASPHIPAREMEVHRRSTVSTCLWDCSSRILYLPTRRNSKSSGCSAESSRLAALTSMSRIIFVTPCVVASSCAALHAMQCKDPHPALSQERSGMFLRATEFRLWGSKGAVSAKKEELKLKTLHHFVIPLFPAKPGSWISPSHQCFESARSGEQATERWRGRKDQGLGIVGREPETIDPKYL